MARVKGRTGGRVHVRRMSKTRNNGGPRIEVRTPRIAGWIYLAMTVGIIIWSFIKYRMYLAM